MSKPIEIRIQGLGHIPSFKNERVAVAPGKMIIQPEIKARMVSISEAIVLELLGLYQTIESETQTECSLQSWIATSLPLDDSLRWFPESKGWTTQKVPKGMEGCILTIEEI